MEGGFVIGSHGLHGGEEEHVPNGRIVRQQHHHAVDADAQAACGGALLG